MGRYGFTSNTLPAQRLAGGTGGRRFDGTNFEPRKVLENAQTPASRVHAVLDGFTVSNEQISKYQ